MCVLATSSKVNMNQDAVTIMTLEDSIVLAINNLVNTFASFIPRLVLALTVLLIGIILGGFIKSLVKRLVHALSLSKLISDSPVERFFEHGQIKIRLDEIIGELFRFVTIYIFLISSFSLLGMQTVSLFLSNILNVIPQILSALLIFILGLMTAGLVESIVKSALFSLDVLTARMAGKIAGYIVMTITTLAAVSELGIAKFFINALFIGFITTMVIGLGLAIGLGAKDFVADSIKRWSKREQSGN